MRKSSRARLFSTCLTGAILAAAAPAWGQTSDAPTWKPRAEAEAHAGKDIGVSTSLFAPLAQNDSSLVYVDGRIGYDQRFDRNGSATVGARFRTGEDTAVGVNIGADFYRSDIGSRDQAAVSMGLEGFSSVFDVRVNYRLPLSKTQTIGFIDPDAAGAGTLVLESNRLIERRSGFRLEAIPLQGFNGEAGVRLPVGGNASIRGSVGGFDYWDRKADENYRGVRGGLELDIEDKDSGARFTFGGVVEHDNRFGTDARAHVRLSIPFGGRAGDRGASPTGLDRQMGDRVRRDYVARSGSRYTDLTSNRFAVDARTGNQFGGFYYASGAGVTGAAGTLAAPTTLNDAVSRAGTNGVVVALGNAGNISTSGVTLATDQYLLGGAGAVDVRLSNGSTTQFALGGTNGVIVGTSAPGATVTLGQGSVVRDVTVRGAGVGIAANGVGGFALDRVTIENTGGAGLSLTNTLGTVSLTGLTVRGGAGAGVLINGGSNVSLANSTISGGAGAIDINDGGANLTASLSNLTLSATGGNVLDIDGSGAGTVTVTGLSGITIQGGNGETGGLSVRSATFDANTATAGLQAVNAGRMEVGTVAARVNGQGVFLTDVTGSLSFTDLDIANTGATGLRVVNSKVNSFTLATLDGTIDTVGGTAADLDPLVINLNFASVSSVGAAGPGVILDTVEGGGTGGNALTIGTLTISNSGGDGLVILNSTGLVRVNGGTIANSGGSSVRIGEQGVAGSGGSAGLMFAGSITDTTGTSPIVAIFSTSGTINFTGPISGSGGIVVQDTLAGSAISFGAITLTGTVGDAITLNNLAGSINFTGLVTIVNPGANGIVIGTVPGGVTFGDVDITGLGNFNGVDVRNTHGTVLFNTLDITGTGTGTGINVTGSTNAGNVMTIGGSTIQGVNIGVDLTQANMTGQFRFGDGNATPMNSTINANMPIVIALMNGANGSYNFADANLVGDTSNLTGAGISAYYARVGATGAGTRNDPGSLAGADASSAQYIVLLNDPAGGQDVFDAADAGGSFDLAAGQSLVSFLNGDFFAVSGAGLPANLMVSGLGPSGITNVYAGSGGAVLTSTAGAATVNLANNSTIDGLVIRNAGGEAGVEGSGVSNVRILNSNIAGATGAIVISDGGAASSVQLMHLDLASTAGTTLALGGAGSGTLTVSATDVDIAATGSAAALSLVDVASGGIGLGAVSTGNSAGGALGVHGVTGGAVTIGSVAVGGSGAGTGISISGNSAAVTVGAITIGSSAGAALQISGNSGTVTLDAVSVGSSGGDAVQVVGNGGAVTLGAISAFGSGGDGVELNGNSGAVSLGALWFSGAVGAGLNIQDALGNVTVAGASISGAAAGVSIDGVAAGSSVTIGSIAVSGSGSGVRLADVDGSVLVSGSTLIANPGTAGIVVGAGSTGSISFGDVDIVGLGANTTGVDARAASGTISFNTLDIAGSSTTGTRGIDLTGATFAGNFTTVESGSITGVGVGVDLTNAAITGSFRDGDGSNTDADGAASSINAVIPIVITGVNVGTGSYNFLDVALTGDTSALTSSSTLYFVRAGATGIGTMTDPGSLAGAEASAADTIILLNDPTGGQDLLDAASAGGSFDLAAGRQLLSFLNGDTLMLPGGAPANLLLYGVPQGQIGNPYAGSGAPVLTTTTVGANTVVLGGSNTIDGVIIGTAGAGGGIGVFGSGVANVAIRNSTISGNGGAIQLIDNGAAASAALSNLLLSSSGGVVLDLDGGGAGTLAITALDDITILGGNGEGAGFFGDSVVFDSDLATAGFQAVSGTVTIGTTAGRVGGPGVYLDQAEGDLDLALDLATEGTGVDITGTGGFRFATSGGSIDVSNGVAYGLLLTDLSADVVLSSLIYSGTGNAVGTQNVAAFGPAGRALDIGALSVADGAAAAITMTGSATGSFSFGAGSSIGTTTGAAILLSNSGASTLNYSGAINYAGVDAVLSVSGGHTGTVSFAGTIDATSGTGLTFQNADGVYNFTGPLSLAAGISITGGSAGSFTFADATIISPAGAAVDILDSTASLSYSGLISYAGGVAAAVNVLNHSGGTVSFTGLLDITTGAGLAFDNADGTYSFNGVTNIDAGTAGIVVANGSGGSFTFGAGTTIINMGGSALSVSASTASIDYLGYAYAFGGNGISVVDHATGTIDFTGATLDLNGASTVYFDNADGSYVFGSFAMTSGATIAIVNGSAGSFSFGDVDLADIGAGQTAVNLTGATGSITFETLDITGIDPTGSKGIDLTGSTTAANIIITESSTITGVGIGVDLTNAAITGTFRYGDGSNTDADGAASSISAITPLVITGLNPVSGGTYDFKDVVLTGDTSGLNTNRTVFWVQAGATGAGTRTDPGSLAAAEASGVDVIILLDTQIGAGQDMIDGATAGGGLDLAANQSLLSFLGGDTLSVGGGAPANVLLFGISGGSVTNPYAGSGAPLLTTTQSGATTVNLASGVLIDGVEIGNLDWKGVFGAGVTGVTIRNSVIHGGLNAIQVIDNGGTANVAFSNLDLSSGSGDVLSLIGSGGGQLAVTQLTGISIAGGNGGSGLYSEDVIFDADLAAASIQTVVGTLDIGNSGSRTGGAGLVLDGATGALELATTVFNTDGHGIYADGGAGGFALTITGGTIDTGPVTTTGVGLFLSELLADIQLTSITYAGVDSGVIANNVTGNGTGGSALDIGTLTVASGASNGIYLGGTTNGHFSFGGGSSITGTTVTGVELANSGTGSFSYDGDITGSAGTLVTASSGDIGSAIFSGTLSATGGTGLQFDNADGTYSFTGTTTLNGGDAGIDIVNGSSGSFTFGTGTSIISPSGIGIDIRNSTAAVTYSGSMTYATAATAAVSILNHGTGTVTFQTGTLNLTNGTGLQFDNADGTYAFTGTTTLNGGDAGIDVLNGSGGSFTFGSGTSITSPSGIGISIADSTAAVTYSGSMTYATAATAAVSILNHGTGTVSFQTGTLNLTNGTGLQFDNADGTYSFTGTTTLNGGDAGIDIVNGSGGSFTFGAGTSITSPSGTGLSIQNSTANVTYSGSLTYATAGQAAIAVAGHNGGTINLQSTTFAVTGGTGLQFDNADGTYQFGSFALSGGAGIAVLNGSGGTFTLGDVDITGLGANQIAVNLTGATGNMTFATLDITGTATTGSKGIDLTGNTGTGDIIVTNSSTITGVGVGVDLTNASRTNLFQYGDGESVVDVASTITATTPLEITGLVVTGTYNFRDVNLVGNTGGLSSSATVYYVQAGASGAGTLADPGSLAGADASTADYIVLLDTQAGAGSFDTITGTLTLANDQALLSFRNTDSFTIGGGAPSNVWLFGVTTGSINNPNSGSGAPLLTSADGTGTVQLGGTSVIDGVVVSNSGAGAGIYASGSAGTATIRNSTISGGGAGIDIRSGAAARIVNLQNLTLANAGSQTGALLNLNGTGGTLTVTGMSNLTIGTGGGETDGLVFNTVTFDSDLATGGNQTVNAGALTIGTTGARVQGDGLSLTNVSGALTFSDLDIANDGGTGLLVANSKANSFLLTTLDGSYDTINGTAVNLDPLTVNITAASISASGGAYGILLDQLVGSFTVTGAVNVTGATTAGVAIQDNTGLTATFNGAVTINNTSGAGISLTNNSGAAITFAGGGTGVDVVTTSGAGLIASGGGTIVFAGSGNSIQTGTGQVLNLNGVTADAGGISFASLGSAGVVAGATAILLNNLDGGAFSGGTVSIAGTSGAISDGIWIGGGSSSTISFGGTTMGGLGDEGIEINGAGNGAVSFTSVAIDNTASHGILITGSDGTVTVSGGDIGNLNDPTGSGVVIDGGSGTITINAGILKTTAARAIDIANRTGGSVSFGGFISSGSAASGWSIMNNSGGTITFSGAGNTINSGATIGIELINNSGSTINFTGGGLAITTSSGTGFSATGGGTIAVTGAGNTIQTATGQIANLSSVSGGTGGINFATLASSGTAASTAISFDNFDGTSFTVTGATTIAGTSGGTSDGIFIGNNSAAAVTFGATTIAGAGDDGIEVNGAGNGAVTFASITIDNTTGQGVEINGSTGTVSINGGSIGATNDPASNGVLVTGGSGTVTIASALTKTTAGSIVSVTGRTGGTVNFTGNMTASGAVNNGISVASNSGGTVNFSGQTISLTTGANTGVNLATNSGATINFAPAGGGNGLDIVTTSGAGFSATGGGTVTVSGSGNSIQTATGQVINLTGVSAGSAGVNFSTLTSTGVVTGIALNFSNFDSSGGGAFSGGTTAVAGASSDGIFIGAGSAANVSFGLTTIGTGANAVGGDGIEINGAGNGIVTFASVDIDNTTAHGVNVTGAVGATGAVTISGGTIGASGLTGDGVNITGGSGDVSIAAAITKTTAGNVVEVSSHTGGAIVFSGDLSATNGAANGILLNNNSGGTIAFSGATKTISTGANVAIQFNNTAATGAAVSFTGGNLDVDTTTQNGITATSTTAGAGSLTITGSNNTITSTSGIALNVVDTNIAAGGLNFLSISATGGTRGIVLDTTGSTAGLTITGSGTTNGSGGTIANTARGIELLNTAFVNISNLNLTSASTTGQPSGQDLTLVGANGSLYMENVNTAVFENMDITGTIADNGITGINVSNFQLNNSLITGAGDGAHESGIEFSNLSGTSSLTNTEIAFSESNSLDIVNTDVSLLNLTLNNVIFRDTQSSTTNGEGGLQFRSFSSAAGAPVTNIDIIDSDFLRLRSQGIQVIGEDDSVVSVDIVNNVIQSQADIGVGIDINGNDTAIVNFNINSNTIQSQGGHSVNITSFLDSTVMGRIGGNLITANGTGAGGTGVRVVAQETSQIIVDISNNSITAGAGNTSNMIDMQARFDTARLDATINNNNIDSDVGALADINITAGSSTAGESNQVYVNILNNDIAAGGPTNVLRLRVSDLASATRLFLTGFVEGGAGIEDDAVATWNAKGNTPVASAASVAVSLSGTAVAPSAGTALTPTNPAP